MKIVLDNVAFDYDLGCKISKLKYSECPQTLSPLLDFWNDIVPASFSDIAKLPNLEQRRIGINALGLDRLVKEVNPTLINSTTLKKSTTWVNENGELVTNEYNDTYELFEVNGDVFSQDLENNFKKMANSYYVKCKDTSTDREYLIWVDMSSVFSTNNSNSWYSGDRDNKKVTSVMAIAWTITTNIELGSIEKILRQGDCILIKPKKNAKILNAPRHLTADEYRTLIVAES
jgi:hypothetical protein